MRTLFSELDVVFIGFGWKDLVLLGTLDKAKRLRAIREDFAVARNVPLGREMNNFAIIERDTFEKDKQKNDYLGKFGEECFSQWRFCSTHRNTDSLNLCIDANLICSGNGPSHNPISGTIE